eukprot:149326-Amphidinium_carterae.1
MSLAVGIAFTVCHEVAFLSDVFGSGDCIYCVPSLRLPSSWMSLAVEIAFIWRLHLLCDKHEVAFFLDVLGSGDCIYCVSGLRLPSSWMSLAVEIALLCVKHEIAFFSDVFGSGDCIYRWRLHLPCVKPEVAFLMTVFGSGDCTYCVSSLRLPSSRMSLAVGIAFTVYPA